MVERGRRPVSLSLAGAMPRALERPEGCWTSLVSCAPLPCAPLPGRLVLLEPSLGHFVGLPSKSCVSSPCLVSIWSVERISCIWDSIACSSLVASIMSSGFTVVSNMEGMVMDELGGFGWQR